MLSQHAQWLARGKSHIFSRNTINLCLNCGIVTSLQQFAGGCKGFWSYLAGGFSYVREEGVSVESMPLAPLPSLPPEMNESRDPVLAMCDEDIDGSLGKD